MLDSRKLLLGASASVSAAGLWAWLAQRTPTSTHHFAPLAVVALFAIVARPADRDPSPTQILITSLGGALIAAVTAGALWATGNLDGPTLWHSRPALPELLGMAALAGFGSFVWQRTLNHEPSGSPSGG